MEPDMESGYVKIHRKRKKTHVAYMVKMGKWAKLIQTITFRLELVFEQTNSSWKGLEEEKRYFHP